MLPALAQARGKARAISDMSNLKQIGLGVIMYADDNDEKLPDDLGALWPYVGTGQVFKSPASKTPVPANAEEVRAGKCDYLYFGKGKKMGDIKDPSATPVACTKPGLLKQGVNVLYCDGHAAHQPAIGEDLATLIRAAGHPPSLEKRAGVSSGSSTRAPRGSSPPCACGVGRIRRHAFPLPCVGRQDPVVYGIRCSRERGTMREPTLEKQQH